MSDVILMHADAFEERFQAQARDAGAQRKAGNYGQWWLEHGKDIRRPVAGIEIKEDTVASIMIEKSDGTPVPLYDDGRRKLGGDGKPEQRVWSNFTLQHVTESRQEKVQIVETFGESYAFFYGERPRTLQCSGVLVNTKDYNWRADFWRNYDQFLRGTKLVEMNARAYLSWDDILVQGYFLGASAVDVAEHPHMIQFNFSMLVTRYQNIGVISNTASAFDLAKGSLLEGLIMLADGPLGADGGSSVNLTMDPNDFWTEASKTQNTRNQVRTQLVELMGSGDPSFAAMTPKQQNLAVDSLLDSESRSVLLNRLRNLQSRSGSSFFEALEEYFMNPQRLLNMSKSIANGNLAGELGNVGYAVFDAGKNDVPQLARYDSAAVGAFGLSKLSPSLRGEQSRRVFGSALGAGVAHAGTEVVGAAVTEKD